MNFTFDPTNADAECTPDTAGGMAGDDTVGNFIMYPTDIERQGTAGI